MDLSKMQMSREITLALAQLLTTPTRRVIYISEYISDVRQLPTHQSHLALETLQIAADVEQMLNSRYSLISTSFHQFQNGLFSWLIPPTRRSVVWVRSHRR